MLASSPIFGLNLLHPIDLVGVPQIRIETWRVTWPDNHVCKPSDDLIKQPNMKISIYKRTFELDETKGNTQKDK